MPAGIYRAFSEFTYLCVLVHVCLCVDGYEYIKQNRETTQQFVAELFCFQMTDGNCSGLRKKKPGDKHDRHDADVVDPGVMVN